MALLQLNIIYCYYLYNELEVHGVLCNTPLAKTIALSAVFSC